MFLVRFPHYTTLEGTDTDGKRRMTTRAFATFANIHLTFASCSGTLLLAGGPIRIRRCLDLSSLIYCLARSYAVIGLDR